MSSGFIMLNRGSDTNWLLRNKNAFVLLSLIALRAQRTDERNIYNLKIGQALVGDYKSCGLTESEYRTAKTWLINHNLATFEPTTRGTIATLCNNYIYDINKQCDDGQDSRQPADKPQPINDFQEKRINNQIINTDILDLAERIYSLYPTHDKNNGNRSTGKSLNDKQKIMGLLSNGNYPIEKAIRLYVLDCEKTMTFLKNLNGFLNYLPGNDIIESWERKYTKKTLPLQATKAQEDNQYYSTPEYKEALSKAVKDASDILFKRKKPQN